jgi:hypothetical protein
MYCDAIYVQESTKQIGTGIVKKKRERRKRRERGWYHAGEGLEMGNLYD